MPEPFAGSDAPVPQGGPVDVNVTALLERIVGIDQNRDNYQAVWWVILTWSDPTAAATLSAATGAAMAPTGPNASPNASASSASACGLPCENSGLGSGGCCDGLWLPRLHVLNIISYPQDQINRYRIRVDPQRGVVTWSTRLYGTWYSPFDFRAYPFEHQHLLLELGLADSQAAQAGLRWEHVAKLNNTPHTKGADLAGWRMKWGKGKLYDSRNCMTEYGMDAARYDPAFPAMLPDGSPAPALLVTTPVAALHAPHGGGAASTSGPPAGSCSAGGYTSVYEEGRALFPAVVLVADIMVKRVSSYYVLTHLFPVLLITLVSFVVFFMPIDALGDRMSVVLTMFLSLTAMQFVFDFPPANYINALEQVVLISYIMISLACIECLLVNRLATVAYTLQNKRSCVRKYGEILHRGRTLAARTLPRLSFSGSRPGAGGLGARREDSAMGGLVIPEGDEHMVSAAASTPLPSRTARTALPSRSHRASGSGSGSGTGPGGRPVSAARSRRSLSGLLEATGILAPQPPMPQPPMPMPQPQLPMYQHQHLYYQNYPPSQQQQQQSQQQSQHQFQQQSQQLSQQQLHHGQGDVGPRRALSSLLYGAPSASLDPPVSASFPVSAASADSAGAGAEGPHSGSGNAGGTGGWGGAGGDGAVGTEPDWPLQEQPSPPLHHPPPLNGDEAQAQAQAHQGPGNGGRAGAGLSPFASSNLQADYFNAASARLPPPSDQPRTAARSAPKPPLPRPPRAGLSCCACVRGAKAPAPAVTVSASASAPYPDAPNSVARPDPEEEGDGDVEAGPAGGKGGDPKGGSRKGDKVAPSSPRGLRGCCAILLAWLACVASTPGEYYSRCKADPEFAEFVAGRIDTFACAFCFVTYVVVVAIVLSLQTMVGDHRLMLGGTPGNM
ncbi:hypothetical protein HYH03_017150 [Edaphochlamys debaryana]|uniref:Uncharacterized protein n=1 Tax=Edaphochlamys debaryana TaxID=47281 RepID=A0A835XJK1_9CHLO|nr:hypothetical protein HYH03_017150 [Edaphochlamys debaryana]|eukprot:KAG2483983.1 hypothetical protein HYH03_017150 [Edaphochlamys debaryana]